MIVFRPVDARLTFRTDSSVLEGLRPASGLRDLDGRNGRPCWGVLWDR